MSEHNIAVGGSSVLATINAAPEARREQALLVALRRTSAEVATTQSIAVQTSAISDLRAIRAMALAYNMSEATQRQIAETSIICLRTLGLSIEAAFPGASNNERSKQVGVARTICVHAHNLAQYSEDEIKAVFDSIRLEGVDAGIHRVLRYLRENDPRYIAAREAANAKYLERLAQQEAKDRSDPDFENLEAVRREFGTYWDACREILRLRRVIESMRGGE